MLLILILKAAKGRRAPRKSWCSYLQKMTDLVAVWEIALSDHIHKIEFEHGTTSRKCIVCDRKEEIQKDWMFKSVGKTTFTVRAFQSKSYC